VAKVLIVDDSLYMRKLIGSILTNAGYEIVGEAGDATEALDKFKQVNPDLVTMDIIMPEDRGMNAMRAVKQMVQLESNVKVIMVSALGQEEFIKEALEAGAKDFIVKPFDEAKVVEKIDQAMKD
jgi:two-component system chemotaxis response regulator CheY